MIVRLFEIAAALLFVYVGRLAYRDSKEADRLEALRGGRR
jgi:hypothetical protein